MSNKERVEALMFRAGYRNYSCMFGDDDTFGSGEDAGDRRHRAEDRLVQGLVDFGLDLARVEQQLSLRRPAVFLLSTRPCEMHCMPVDLFIETIAKMLDESNK